VVEPQWAPARQLQPVQLVAAQIGVDQQQRGAVRPPVGHLDLTGQVDLQVGALAAQRVPHRRPQAAMGLRQQGDALVARHRREAHGEQPVAAAVPEVGQRGAALEVECPQGGMQVVAVLGMLHHQDAPIPAHAGHVHGLLVAVQLHAGRAGAAADQDREADPGGQAQCDPPVRPQRQPSAPGRLGAWHQRQVVAAGERLQPPLADLIALGVVEPHHALAVGCDRAGHHTGRVPGDLPLRAAGAVPGVHLPGA
jgi:hypothetical protein